MKKFSYSKSRPKYILYVDRNSMGLLKGDQKLIKLDFEPTVVKDMDIISTEDFIITMAEWFEKFDVKPCDMIIVLSKDMYFDYQFQTIAGQEAVDTQINLYLETVPFEEKVSKHFNQDGNTSVVVLSRDYYESLLEFLEKRYIRVLALFPSGLLRIDSVESVNFESLIKGLETHKNFNFLDDFELKSVESPILTNLKPKDTRLLKVTSAIFILLALILGVMIYFTFLKK